VKQILVESASKIDPTFHIYEQGNGKIDLVDAFRLAQTFVPKLSAIPAALDLTDCPFMWPYCKQPIFWGSMPLIFNVTLLNSGSVRSRLAPMPVWRPAEGADYLNVSFSFSPEVWPYSGWIAIHVIVASSGSKLNTLARGTIVVFADVGGSASALEIPLAVQIVPTPPKSKRVLWDQFHNIRYPSAFAPRDSFEASSDRPFDWQADHPFTNFEDVFNALTSAGYFVDILSVPYSCIDLRNYGVLLVMDPEDEFFEQEIQAVHSAVISSEISLIVIADWYELELMKSLRFFDENTRQWWVPVTGGSNVPALNDLLRPFGIQLNSRSFSGDFFLGDKTGHFASGTSIGKFPAGGLIYRAPLVDDSPSTGSADSDNRPYILGLLPAELPAESSSGGRVSVFGDSSCMDSSSRQPSKNCIWMLLDLLRWSSQALLPSWAGSLDRINESFAGRDPLPTRLPGSQLFRFSRVLNHQLFCFEQNTVTSQLVPMQAKNPKPSRVGFFKEDTFIRRADADAASAVLTPDHQKYFALLFVAVAISVIWLVSTGLRHFHTQDSQLG
jgi:membrane-bound transcription factor site-1 protease